MGETIFRRPTQLCPEYLQQPYPSSASSAAISAAPTSNVKATVRNAFMFGEHYTMNTLFSSQGFVCTTGAHGQGDHARWGYNKEQGSSKHASKEAANTRARSEQRGGRDKNFIRRIRHFACGRNLKLFVRYDSNDGFGTPEGGCKNYLSMSILTSLGDP